VVPENGLDLMMYCELPTSAKEGAVAADIVDDACAAAARMSPIISPPHLDASLLVDFVHPVWVERR
jgi:hypothetical protein